MNMEGRSLELARFFFKLGIIGFGGPAVHIAMMEEEVVERRQWLTREHFLDLVGATNLIPGPNSTEMAIHIGYSYGGVVGLAVAGVCFIAPAVLMTGFLAWLYVNYGTLPAFAPLLYGIKPAVLAIIVGALWRLGKKALKSRSLFSIAGLAIGLLLLGANEVVALLIGGFFGMLWLRLQSPPDRLAEWAIASLNFTAAGRAAASSESTSPGLWQLGLFFLKVGSILFGSGYVFNCFFRRRISRPRVVNPAAIIRRDRDRAIYPRPDSFDFHLHRLCDFRNSGGNGGNFRNLSAFFPLSRNFKSHRASLTAIALECCFFGCCQC
jgi:chromate transporter